MKISPHGLVSLFSIILLLGFASSLHISLDEFESHPATSRALLREKKPCKEDFANKDYTIITSRCKGPNYQANECCSAFKEFACPYAEAISDKTTECAAEMFYFIEIYGHYPLRLFVDMCSEGEGGMDCTSVNATSPSLPPA
ncbi:unnamed protein product [Eruca vesicaria subsp. sativa]|uniref:GPI-anchored protein LLG1-like domain-containing protein n=1 Tax=Eruca vesicaria subsp. sativa TaxID=29727 RepID=A0ABC8JB11_ERUVS|nr:unnamed protein product [Eruca vesicaria subsp. sativa]